MFKTKFILSIVTFLIIYSCGKCVETNLTNTEKEWFSVYDKGQIIIFKSNEGNLDTNKAVGGVQDRRYFEAQAFINGRLLTPEQANAELIKLGLK